MSRGGHGDFPGFPGERPFPGSGRGLAAGGGMAAGGDSPPAWEAGGDSPPAWEAPRALPGGDARLRRAPGPVAAPEPGWEEPTVRRADACPFGICDGSGFAYDEATNTAYDCRCRAERITRRRAVSLTRVIPRKYEHVSFDRPPVTDMDPTVVTATRRFVERIDENLDTGRGLWFMGPVGTGKTTLAMLVTMGAMRAHRSVARYSLPELLRHIRESFAGDGSHGELLDRLAAVDLLHIDDVGAERTTDWVLEELYSIVNARYEDQRSMVITTNILDREALCEQITERTVSRLTEMCEELPLLGDDHRMDPRT